MNTLVIYSSVNTEGKKDATGAFIPEAEEFGRMYDVPGADRLGVDCLHYLARHRREDVCSFLRNKKDIDLIGIFCHGWPNGLQIGFNKQHIHLLVQYLKLCCRKDVKIVLYACSTASNKENRKMKMPFNVGPATDRGFADSLRDSMLKDGFLGGWVDAHKTAGHTTRNPFVVRFYVEPTFEDTWDLPGGEWLVSPKSKLWRDWRPLLQTDFRFKFPVMDQVSIYMGLS